MKSIIIHGKTVTYDESDPAQEHAAHWMEKNPDNAKAILAAAHHDHINNKAEFDINKPAGYNGASKFNAFHTGNDQYKLDVHHHHLF